MSVTGADFRAERCELTWFQLKSGMQGLVLWHKSLIIDPLPGKSSCRTAMRMICHMCHGTSCPRLQSPTL
jgi:hypothetical protein